MNTRRAHLETFETLQETLAHVMGTDVSIEGQLAKIVGGGRIPKSLIILLSLVLLEENLPRVGSK